MASLVYVLMSVVFAALFYAATIWFLGAYRRRRFLCRHAWFHPNSISAERVIICWIGILLYGAELAGIGILLFTFGAMLDAVDGLVARKCNFKTVYGESFDPLCDKLSYLPALLYFSLLGYFDLSLWVVLVVVEFLGQFGVRGVLKQACASRAANKVGKVKAAACFAVILYCVLLGGFAQLPDLVPYCVALCIILSAASAGLKLAPKLAAHA